MKNTKRIIYALVAVTLLVFSSCNKNDADGYGTLRVMITDAPFPIDQIDEANVTISKVETRMKSDSGGSDFVTLMEETMSFNLLDLRNGVMAELLEMEMPVGSYDLFRLYVDTASIVLKDGNSFEVVVPSGAQTGIKIFINPDLRIEGGLTSELLLDFNLEKSFVMQGNDKTPAGIKGFHFKPVIRATNNSTSGTVEGTVSDTSSTVLANAEVWIAQDSTITTAYTDSTGYYAIPGMPEGFYSLYATKENHDTVMVGDLEIVPANIVKQDFALIPLN